MWRDCEFSEEFIVVNDNKCQLKTGEYEANGTLPIIDQGEKNVAGYTSQVNKKYKKQLPVVLFGDHTRHVKYIDFDFVAGADGTQLIRPKNIDDKFFYYLTCFTVLQLSNYGYDRHMKHLKEAKVKFPTEQIEQKAIAEVLDTVDEAIAATQAMLDKQYKIKDGLLQDLLTRGVDENGKLRHEK